jgi:hypothetical protein
MNKRAGFNFNNLDFCFSLTCLLHFNGIYQRKIDYSEFNAHLSKPRNAYIKNFFCTRSILSMCAATHNWRIQVSGAQRKHKGS